MENKNAVFVLELITPQVHSGGVVDCYLDLIRPQVDYYEYCSFYYLLYELLHSTLFYRSRVEV